MDPHNPLHRAIINTIEQGGPDTTIRVDLNKSTIIPGSPGIYDGLVIASWHEAQEPRAVGVEPLRGSSWPEDAA